MKNFIIIFIFLFGSKLLAQDLNHYKYVIVPEKFEFQDEPNEHQLNALMEFLFEKYGIKALYQEEISENLVPCEGLTANVLNESGFFTTRLILTLEDCYGKVIFSSKEGESREKQFKTAYHEAIRDAFLSVEALNYHYEPNKKEAAPEKSALSVRIIPKEAHKNEIVADSLPNEGDKSALVQKFRNGNTVYFLKETRAGFNLFQERDNEEFASLTQSARKGNYLYSSEKLNGNAFFDSSGNLIVEYIDATTGQLVSLKYLLEAQ